MHIFSSDSDSIAAMTHAEVSIAMAEEDKPYADAVQVFRDLACASNSIRTKWPRVPVSHIVQQCCSDHVRTVLPHHEIEARGPREPEQSVHPLLATPVCWCGNLDGKDQDWDCVQHGIYWQILWQCQLWVFCLLGDSESWENYIWKALAFSSHYNLDDLMAIFHSGILPVKNCIDIHQKCCEAFGWNT